MPNDRGAGLPFARISSSFGAVLCVALPCSSRSRPAQFPPRPVHRKSPLPANARTINTLPRFPKEALRRGVNRPLFRSLGVSPITAWIVARAPVSGSNTKAARIVQSDAGGAFDQMALELANSYTVSGTNSIDSHMALDTLTVHLLIYQIADGHMAVCFADLDDSRYADYRQLGAAWVAVHKNGKWTTISREPPRP